MAAAQQGGLLNRLAGKSVFFGGMFEYDQEDFYQELTAAQNGKVAQQLSRSVDYAVFGTGGNTNALETELAALNKAGAAIQRLSPLQFERLTRATSDELLALIRYGIPEYREVLFKESRYTKAGNTELPTVICNANLSGVQIPRIHFDTLNFRQCNFAKAKLEEIWFLQLIEDCDFTGAKLKRVKLWCNLQQCNFTNARLSYISILHKSWRATAESTNQNTTSAAQGLSFVAAKLEHSSIAESSLQAPDFSKAEITNSWFIESELKGASFVGAKLENVRAVGCKFVNANFTNADLTGTNLAYTDLTGANFKGANLRNVNLRGAIIKDAKLSQAKNLAKDALKSPTLGPALKQLDHIAAHAERMQVAFKVPTFGEKEVSHVSIDFPNVQNFKGMDFPSGISIDSSIRAKLTKFSDALIFMRNIVYPMKVTLEQVAAGSKKSPLGGKALWGLMVRAVAEAFEQPLPKTLKLEPLPDKKKITQAIARLKSEKADLLERTKQEAEAAAALGEAEVRQDAAEINREVKKTIGPVNDPAKFLQALELRLEKPKIKNATAMLRASGFELFLDLTSKQVTGVVKSQRDASLVYACYIGHDGKYSCCTQNLNMCGGLRGSICKHLLVLLIGLVKAGKLAPATIDQWIAKSRVEGASFDEETMTAVFLKYKSAELGEIDWRPTETIPEDYYT